MIRTLRLAAASILGLAAMLLGAGGVAHAQTPPGTFAASPTFSAGSQAGVVFLGGTIDQLEAASSAAGPSGAWAQDASGGFQLLLIGGPAFLKDALKARFPGGFPSASAITLTRTSTAPAPPPPASPPPAPPQTPAKWTSASAPAGATIGGGDWIAVDAPGGKTILAEVFRPTGAGPFPVVVFLYGQGGFSNTFLRTGSEIARAGFVTVVGCWFGGNYDGTSNAESPTPVSLPDGVACPNGPTLKSLTSTAAVDDVSALLAAARTLPDFRSDRVALVGNSRGSVTALLTASLAGGSLQATTAIADAPPGGVLLALGISAPVLLLQGDADTVVPGAEQPRTGGGAQRAGTAGPVALLSRGASWVLLRSAVAR